MAAAAVELANGRADAMAEQIKNGANEAEAAAAQTSAKHGEAAACFREEGVRAASELLELRERCTAMEQSCAMAAAGLTSAAADLKWEKAGR